MSANACSCREREREREREGYNLTKKYVISQEGVFLSRNIPK